MNRIVFQRDCEAEPHGRRQFSLKPVDYFREPVSGSSLMLQCVNARVFDDERSCYCVNLGGLPVRVFRPAVDPQARMSPCTEKLDERLNDFPVGHELPFGDG